MLPILVICLMISSARSCTLPNPLNETIELQNLVGSWYTQFTLAGPPANSYSCWKNVVTQEGEDYQIVSSAIDLCGTWKTVTAELILIPNSSNVLRVPDLNDRRFEINVLGLVTNKRVIYGNCLPPDDTPAYYIKTSQPSPDEQEIERIKSELEELGLNLDDFTKHCNNPNDYDHSTFHPQHILLSTKDHLCCASDH
ncbi:hypothetical protein L9F63_003852 [Diploptera punctata]|uniref:Lipocalin/cytosolic fatty-acid binding domain-containing protein n=1 Tax=Diploptera punctata TaxID=6984 RepID=A0AAD7ZKZ3_DIPPU|nr:hypothetical protein L9F63_003852 [Diploptera punctata]